MKKIYSATSLAKAYSALVFFILQPSHKYLITSYLLRDPKPGLVLLFGASATECLALYKKHSHAKQLIIPIAITPSKSSSLIFNSLLSFAGFLSRLFFGKSILVLKSTSYHQPLLSNQFYDIAYLGDGFGVSALDGQMPPWLITKSGQFDQIKLSSINAGLVVFRGKTGAMSYSGVDIDLSLACSLRSILLHSGQSSLSPKQLLSLKSITNVLCLNRLGNIRLSSYLEPRFWAEYISSSREISRENNVLILPHPSMRVGGYIDLLSAELSKACPDLVFRFLGNLADDSPLAHLSVSAEELASIFLSHKDELNDKVIFHVFQSGVFPLRLIFPEINISFGFGGALIKKYFWLEAAALQAQFEDYVNLEFFSS